MVLVVVLKVLVQAVELSSVSAWFVLVCMPETTAASLQTWLRFQPVS